MSLNPIREAFEFGDHEPSISFRNELRVRFLDAVDHPGGEILGDSQEAVVILAQEPTGHQPRRPAWLGVAAAIVLTAGLGVILMNNKSGSTGADSTRDATIAREALVKVTDLGSGWDVADGGLTSHAVAGLAAKVPECGPYMDAAFDSPAQKSTTSGRVTAGLGNTLTEWVYVFPSKEAASNAMDKIAEPGFVRCFTNFWEVFVPVYAPGARVNAEPIDTPSLLPHGERQIAITLQPTYSLGSVTTSPTIVNAFVQVGRAIAYIDPIADEHASTDPTGSIEKALSLATSALEKALAEQR